MLLNYILNRTLNRHRWICRKY